MRAGRGALLSFLGSLIENALLRAGLRRKGDVCEPAAPGEHILALEGDAMGEDACWSHALRLQLGRIVFRRDLAKGGCRRVFKAEIAGSPFLTDTLGGSKAKRTAQTTVVGGYGKGVSE